MDTLSECLSLLSDWVWGTPMLVLLVGTGIYLTVLLRGLQFRRLGTALKLVLHKEQKVDGDISHFAALTTALAATVGTGNIVGVALAISTGGPGAVFWMWMTGLVGMATKYAEALLAVHYREKGSHGMRGGPMYYLAKGAGLPWLGVIFAIFTVGAAFGIGNMSQANSAAGILHQAFGIDVWLTGLILLMLTGMVLIGGIKSIGRFTSALVPFMILMYMGAALVVVILNIERVPTAFHLIFWHAFNPAAAAGGFAGAAVAAAIQAGVSRGIFSNESGLGSAPIAAAAAKTNDPVRQALVSMTQTFIDTLLVCTSTALVILTSSVWNQPQAVTAEVLTALSFAETLGHSGVVIVACATVLFAYSTLIGWSYYGEKALEFLAGEKSIILFRLIFVAAVMCGAVLKLDIVWDFSDVMNGLMALPNLIGILLLSKVVKQESERYFNQH